ncbi:unnamed protein product [Sphenostylis stenocarpa]|uniref:Uncharacterized protein n=1 Tax=Sphenostylis stenocarpa TaxID=92480 RepID=A0AA87B6S1_9FABA|nr:unnamed protein product [Sphenostylis stenocarpa]
MSPQIEDEWIHHLNQTIQKDLEKRWAYVVNRISDDKTHRVGKNIKSKKSRCTTKKGRHADAGMASASAVKTEKRHILGISVRFCGNVITGPCAVCVWFTNLNQQFSTYIHFLYQYEDGRTEAAETDKRERERSKSKEAGKAFYTRHWLPH